MSFRRRALFLAGLFVAVSCSDAGNPVGPPVDPTPRPGPGEGIALDCSLHVATGTLECGTPGGSTGGALGDNIIIGGQNVKVKLVASGHVETGGVGDGVKDTLAINVTVKNLMAQALGTTDGTTPDGSGVQLFFARGPIGQPTGDANMVNALSGMIIEPNTDFYQYNEILSPDETSAPQKWIFASDESVTNIQFGILVKAAVPFPGGFIKVTPTGDTLAVGETVDLEAIVYNAQSDTLPVSPTWSSNAPAVATVDASSGLVTAVGFGTAVITATHGSKTGTATIVVNDAPVLTADTTAAVSNVTVPRPAGRLLAKATDAQSLSVVADSINTAQNGVVIANSDGSFTYLSAPGFSGEDSFQFRVTDGVSITTGTMVVNVAASNYWYVRAGPAAVTADGRDRRPFGSIAAAQAVAEVNDTIFVLEAGVPLDGPAVLENGQGLIGVGIASPIFFKMSALDSVAVMTPGAMPGLTRADAGNTVTLAQNNAIAGLGISAANGAAVAGTSFGTLKVRETAVNPAGPALLLNGGALDAEFATLSSTGSTTTGLSLTNVTGALNATAGTLAPAAGAAGRALLVSGGSATLNLGVAVTDASEGIEISGVTGGEITVSGALALTGKGITVQNNTGGTFQFTGSAKELTTGANPAVTLSSNTGATVSFGGGNLDVETTSGAGVTGNGGGTLSITGANNRLVTGTGTALSLVGVGTGASGISLFQVEVGAGAPNGIVLNAISGRGVQVTGVAGTAGTAGTIGATTGHRIQLTNTGIAPVELGPLLLNGALVPTTVGLNASGADSIKVDALNVDVTGGAALSLFSSGLYGAFHQVKSVGSPDNGVVLNGVAGTVALPLDLSGAAATTLAILGGSLNATITGTVAQATPVALLLNVSGAHSGMLTFGGTLSATNGNGLQLSDADGIYTFTGTTTLNGGNAGIDVTNGSTGAITFGSGTSITNPVGTALDISNASAAADVSYAGTISTNAGRPVSVSGVSGGTVTVSGSITATGQGISVASNTGGTVAFTSSTKTLTTGANAAVTLSNNPGATVEFGGGNLAITTTTGTGFSASGGGTVQVTGADNTIGTTGGIALALANVATSASGVNLASVSATGGTNGISLSDLTGAGVQVNGGTVQNTTGNAVSLSNLSGLTTGVKLAGMTLARSGAVNMVLSGSSFGNLDLTGTTVNATGGGRAIDLTTGSLAGTITAINAASSSGTPVTFTGVSGSATVNGGTISNGSLVGNLVVSGGSVSLDWRGNLSQATNNVALLRVNNGHTGTLTFQTGTLSATDGQALQLDNADGTYNFNGTTTVSGTDRGIDILNGSAGTFSFSTNVSVTNPVAAAPALFVDASAPAVTYAGTLSTNAARPVQIEDLTGGSVAVSGAITSTGQGILVQNNTAGTPTVTFTGAKTLTTGANAAVTLDNNDAATITFSGGTLGVTTTSGAGFSAVNGGTVNVTGAGNAISSGSGTALNVQNTTIGVSGLSFASISHSGGANGNGIVLDNTGANNGLQVTGTGGVAGSGGTITNTLGADGSTQGAGIYLNNTRAISLAFMALSGHANWAIRGNSVVGFTMNKVRITGTNGTSAATDDGGILFTELTGTASITGSLIDGGFEHGMLVDNTGGTLNRITFDGDTIGSSSGIAGDGLRLEAGGSGVLNATIQNTRFARAAGDMFQHNIIGSAQSDLDFLNNTLINSHPAISGGGGGITVTAAESGDLTYDINGNTVRGSKGPAMVVNKPFGGAPGNGTMTGFIRNNVIGTAGGTQDGSSEGSGMLVGLLAQGTHTTRIEDNQIYDYEEQGIFFNIGGTSQSVTGLAHNGTINATVVGNTIAEPLNLAGALAQNGIHLNAGTNSDGGNDAYQVCMDIGSGTAADRNTLNGSGAAGGTDFRLRQRFATTVRLPGYTSGNTDNAAVTAYVQNRNNNSGITTGGATNTVATGGGGFINTAPAGSACPQP